MTFLIVFGVIALLVLGVLFIPFRVSLCFDGELNVKVSFLKIPLFKGGNKKKPEKEKDGERSDRQKPKKENGTFKGIKEYFKKVKKESGLTATLKEGFVLISEILGHIKRLFRHINICRVKLNITVGTPDAALTAIEYGEVCAAVYPVTAFLDGAANVGFKEINVQADFEGGKSNFGFSAAVKIQIFYLAICAIKIFKPLKKFITEKNENERK